MTYISHRQQPVSEQTLAQAELNQYINQQAQAVAPERLSTVEVHSQHFEIYAGKQLIAYITYDHSDYITQRWVVMVQGNEIFRHNTVARCLRYVEWHYKDGTLPTPLPAPVEYPEVPTVAEISFYDQELIADGQLIASVEYDHDEYADLYWRVMINGCEIYRDTTPARCHSYVKQAYQQGMLPVQEEDKEQGAGSKPIRNSQLQERSLENCELRTDNCELLQHPAPCPPACSNPVSASENRVMAHIFDECQKYGFEILDDGIYNGDTKLGKVGCTKGNWWVILGCSGQPQYSNSVFDAVRALVPVSELSDAELDDCEQLLDLPFDMLTPQDWQRLKTYEPDCDLAAA